MRWTPEIVANFETFFFNCYLALIFLRRTLAIFGFFPLKGLEGPPGILLKVQKVSE